MKKNTFIFRKAESKDLQAIGAIHRKHFGAIGETVQSAKQLFQPTNQNVSLYVATTAKGELVGYGQVIHGKRTYLSWGGIAPKFYGQGVGAFMLEKALRDIRAKGGKEVNLDTRNRFKHALAVYLRFDFDIIGTWIQSDGELMVRLRKKLHP